MLFLQQLFSRAAQSAFLPVFCLLLSGCGSVALKREPVAQLEGVEIVHVVTPPLESLTFMQAAVKSGTLGGVIPAVIAQAERQSTLASPGISDLGGLIAEKLQKRIPEKAPWWPPMTRREAPVPADYISSQTAWLRIEIWRYELAPTFKRILAFVKVSLRQPGDKGGELWATSSGYSGLVHGGEKVIEANLPQDPSQLNREIDRAADWIVTDILASLR